jgi:hypothetical protein
MVIGEVFWLKQKICYPSGRVYLLSSPRVTLRPEMPAASADGRTGASTLLCLVCIRRPNHRSTAIGSESKHHRLSAFRAPPLQLPAYSAIWPDRAMAVKSQSWGGLRRRAGAKLQYASFDGAFAGTIMCKSLINAAYSATMFNAGKVNVGSACPELVDFCKNLLGKCKFVFFKTPVKYNRRSWLCS